MPLPSILHADDHRMITDSLQVILSKYFTYAGNVGDGRALLDAYEVAKPDIVLLDISMPLLNGLDAAAMLKKSRHSAKIVFLSMHREVSYAAKAYELGAAAYVLKHSSPEELIGAIRIALRGEKYVPPVLAGPLLEQFRTAPSRAASEVRLTPRERQVLQLLAEGRCAKETASMLNISPRTVEFHKYRIMEDYGLKSTAELVRLAMQEGLVS